MTKSENVVRRVRAAGLERNEKRESKGDSSWRDVSVSSVNQYVSENLTRITQEEFRGVEVLVPSARLPGGRCFVDSSGLGSAFTGNTAATRAFIPTSMRRWS